MKRIYRVRWQIEEVFRLLKQEFGQGRCRAASMQSQKAHSQLGLCAFVSRRIKQLKKIRRICFQTILISSADTNLKTICAMLYSHCVISVKIKSLSRAMPQGWLRQIFSV